MKFKLNFLAVLFALTILAFLSCQRKQNEEIKVLVPSEIVDLGTLVTEELPYQLWGKDLMDAFGFEKPNNFDVRDWAFDYEDGKMTG
jgi:hypothetical protein